MVEKSDWKYIDFQAEHEMNYILSKFNMPQDEYSREFLRSLEAKAKAFFKKQSRDNLTHKEFYQYLCEKHGLCH